MLVADVFAVGDLARYVLTGPRVVVILCSGDGVSQSSGWAEVAVEDVNDGVPGLLAKQCGVEHGRPVGTLGPVVEDARANGVHHNDSIVAVGRW